MPDRNRHVYSTDTSLNKRCAKWHELLFNGSKGVVEHLSFFFVIRGENATHPSFLFSVNFEVDCSTSTLPCWEPMASLFANGEQPMLLGQRRLV